MSAKSALFRTAAVSARPAAARPKSKRLTSFVLFLCLVVSVRASTLIEINRSNLISRADLDYEHAVDRIEDGMPIGNGRMGSLVWTTPSAIRFQINRNDVFGNGTGSDSFPERHTDYCGGCAFVDIDFADYALDVFQYEHTTQHLSCYDGAMSLQGRDVRAEILAWNERDVIALHITDNREHPGPININLRMLRSPFERHLSQTAVSRLDGQDGTMTLTQNFSEQDYHCGSVVAVSVTGRETKLNHENEREFRLLLQPQRGSFTVLISSAASFSPNDNLTNAALEELKAAQAKDYAALAESNRDWWHDFWAKSFIHLHSDDGIADTVERDYNYFLYLMGASSRGKHPTKFNGMLWSNGGDHRQWGGQFWGANQSCLYNNTEFAANHAELLDPMFDMYSGMFDSCALAAKQQWGSEGVWFPETVAFDGLAPLPDDIAAEMRELYLLQKSWSERSQKFLDYAGTKIAYSSRWNWIGGGRWADGRWTFTERGGGPFGPVTHTFGRSAKIAYQYWLRYEYTHDEQWLRDRAYPVVRGAVEFYRNFPNLKKEADGKYHIHHVNSNESVWGAQDTDEEISGMMGILPVAIRASEILNTNADLRLRWRELLENLAPLPRSDNPNAAPMRFTNTTPVWIRGLPPAMPPRDFTSSRPDGNTMPMWFFDLCTLESDSTMFEIGSNTFNGYVSGNNPGGFGMRGTNATGTNVVRRFGGGGVGVLSKVPLTAAVMGRSDAVKKLIPAQFNTNERGGILANRMDLREGAQTTTAQRLGNASDALHTALCYDLPAGPAQPNVIRVFAAWPESWDAEFNLLARDGFLVTSAMHKGKIPFVQLNSQLGGECRLRNPWPETEVTLYRNGNKAENLKGSLLNFETQKGEEIIVVRAGTAPRPSKIEL